MLHSLLIFVTLLSTQNANAMWLFNDFFKEDDNQRGTGGYNYQTDGENNTIIQEDGGYIEHVGGSGNNFVRQGNGGYIHSVGGTGNNNRHVDYSQNCIKGSGILSEKNLDLPNSIDSVIIAALGTLKIISGNKTSLLIKAENNILEYLEQKIASESTLQLSPRNNPSIAPTQPILYTLTLQKSPKYIEAKGNAIIKTDSIVADTLECKGSENSNIQINQLKLNNLSVCLVGRSLLTILGGGAKEQILFCSGNSSYNGKDFKSQECSIKLSGNSEGSVNCYEKIVGKLEGASYLTIKGNPDIQKIHTSGVSSYSN